MSEVIQNCVVVLSTQIYDDPTFFVSQHLYVRSEHGLNHSSIV